MGKKRKKTELQLRLREEEIKKISDWLINDKNIEEIEINICFRKYILAIAKVEIKKIERIEKITRW